MLIYVRAMRISDCHLYVDGLSNIVPWLFFLDHTHYARCIPVHIHDMVSSQANYPDVYERFLKGEFTVLKTVRAFSAIPIDQCREQKILPHYKGEWFQAQRWPELLRNLQHLVMPEKTLTYDTMSKTNTHRNDL